MKTPFAFAATFTEEMRQLQELDFAYRLPGADLREDAYRIITSYALRRWIEQSDELAEKLRGQKRLRRRRRLGILRNNSYPDLGLPFFRPARELYVTADSPDPLILPAMDELDWIVLPGRIENNTFTPLKLELNFDEARALLGMRASSLYELTRQQVVPGQLVRQLGDNPDRNLRELRFNATELITWAVSIGLFNPKVKT